MSEWWHYFPAAVLLLLYCCRGWCLLVILFFVTIFLWATANFFLCWSDSFHYAGLHQLGIGDCLLGEWGLVWPFCIVMASKTKEHSERLGQKALMIFYLPTYLHIMHTYTAPTSSNLSLYIRFPASISFSKSLLLIHSVLVSPFYIRHADLRVQLCIQTISLGATSHQR